MTDAVTTLTALKTKIETEAAALNTAIRTSLGHARAIGECLLEAKAALKGEETGFVDWVRANCPFSYPSAANYMKVAREWGRFDEETLARFTIREFLAATAERAPRKSPAPAASGTAGGGGGGPPVGLAIAPAPGDDDRLDGEGDRPEGEGEGEEYGQRLPDEVGGTSAPTRACGVGPEPATTVLPIRPAISAATDPAPDAPSEARVEAVAREVGIPADKLRVALVKLGFLPAAPH